MLPLLHTGLVSVSDGISVAFHHPVCSHLTNITVAKCLWGRQQEKRSFKWKQLYIRQTCVNILRCVLHVPGWSSWGGCPGTEQQSETSRGLQGCEMRQETSMRCPLWNPPCLLRYSPPLSSDRIQLTCTRGEAFISRRTCASQSNCYGGKHTLNESRWSQTLQPRNICW